MSHVCSRALSNRPTHVDIPTTTHPLAAESPVFTVRDTSETRRHAQGLVLGDRNLVEVGIDGSPINCDQPVCDHNRKALGDRGDD
jgi:hypothetical protein